jgi:hypothetical protein
MQQAHMVMWSKQVHMVMWSGQVLELLRAESHHMKVQRVDRVEYQLSLTASVQLPRLLSAILA